MVSNAAHRIEWHSNGPDGSAKIPSSRAIYGNTSHEEAQAYCSKAWAMADRSYYIVWLLMI